MENLMQLNETFVAIGNDELLKTTELGLKVNKGDKLVKGLLSGILEYGKDGTTGKESNILGFVTAVDSQGESHSYVAVIKDQLVFGWEKSNV